MIRTFRHRGLKRVFQGDTSKVRADQARRIADDLPGYRLHPLKGALKGMWSVTISGNWRITFRFADGDAFEVDLTDYH